MKRSAINPWGWSRSLGYDQAVLVSGAARTLYCAGQTATDGDGQPCHPGDMAAQLALCLDNLEAVLHGADMTLANLVRLTIYTPDVNALFPHYGVLLGRLGAAGVAPAMTLLGGAQLARAELMVELEGIAAG